MSKEVVAMLRLQIPGGSATPAPPVGPALGQKQVNIMEFCKQFNDATKDIKGIVVTVVISVYKDKSFSFVVKKPTMTYYVKKLAKITSGSKTPGRGGAIATVKRKDIEELVKEKMPDLNCFGDINAAVKMFEGSARSIGVKVED